MKELGITKVDENQKLNWWASLPFEVKRYLGVKYGLLPHDTGISQSEVLEVIYPQEHQNKSELLQRYNEAIEVCKKAYAAIRHENNPSNSMLNAYFKLEQIISKAND